MDEQSLEVLVPMAFLNLLLTSSEINWLSKDIIFLAYPSESKTYGRAAKDFIDFYYSENHTWDLPRSGIIRQMVSLEIENNGFTNLALKPCNSFIFSIDPMSSRHRCTKAVGLNTMLPDFDYYAFISEAIQAQGITMVIDENMEIESKINESILKTIKQIRPYFKGILPIENYLKEPYTFYLNSLKQMMLSNPHDLHSYFLE